MQRAYNFSPGPAMLPEEVMIQAQEEFLNWQGTGMSVMEVSHRSKEFKPVIDELTDNFRTLYNIPDQYHIIFAQGGARAQYSMVPMNLLNGAKTAAYVKTGIWGGFAVSDASRYCKVQLLADTESSNFTSIPKQVNWQALHDSSYLFYVDNETVNGVEFPFVPDDYGLPLICDMSSNILTRPIDIERFGLIFACSQKNLSLAGMTVVMIHDDLLKRKVIEATPELYRYQVYVDKQSMPNTPVTFSWYIAALVTRWVIKQGGLVAMDEITRRKSSKLYDYIDQTGFYMNPIDPEVRSRLNVIFKLADPEKEAVFLQEAQQENLRTLKGHRLLGGIRASLYIGMPESGADALLEFMRDFEQRYG